MELDFGGLEPEECDEGLDPEMTIGELMEWRYFKAERAKELVCDSPCSSPISLTLCRATNTSETRTMNLPSSSTPLHTTSNRSCPITSLI